MSRQNGPSDFLDEAGVTGEDFAKAILRALGWNPDDPVDMEEFRKVRYNYKGIYLYDTRTGERV